MLVRVSMLSRLGFARDVLTADSTYLIPPWTGSSDVSQVATLPQEIAQAFGINTSTDYVTADQAMSIPAVRAAYLTIAGKIGSTPLVCVRERAGNPPERVQRTFLDQPDPVMPRAATLTATVGDLMFYGLAYWYVLARDFAGFPTQARRLHPSRVVVDTMDGSIRVDGQQVWDPVKQARVDRGEPGAPRCPVIIFPPTDRGLLYIGARTLKTALLLEDAIRRYARMDVPLGLITDDTGAMLEDEITTFLDSWEAARAARTTAYLPVGLHYDNPGFNAQQVELADARGFQAAEIARLLNLPASTINAPTGDSLTYATTVENARTLVDITFAPYRAALEGRLSMGDVTPAGSRVFLDFAEFQRGDTKTVIETGAAAVAAGLMTVDEIRTSWLHLGPMPTGGAPDDGTAPAV